MNIENLLSDKIKSIPPSGIRKFFDLAQGVPGVISLGVGEPDFQTPWAIRQTAIESLERKRMTYSANAGMPILKKTIAEYTKKKIDTEYNPDEVIVTVGGSEAVDIAVRAVINAGDEVLIPEPCFVCYSPIVSLAGGVPVPIETKAEDKFKLKAEALKEKITDKTKLLFLPYPNNPTGAIMTREDLQPIADVLMARDILIVSDEIYSELTYNGKHVSLTQIEGMKERTILVSGFSKAFAMTGWRLGYLCAHPAIVKQALKIHQYAVMCSPTLSQYSAITAMTECESDVQKMKDEYNMRRRFCVAGFNRIGLDCFEPEGAFYVFPSIKSTGLSSEDFCARLLESEKVAVVPGSAFGTSGEGYIRVSYAYSLKHLSLAIEKIEKFIKVLK